MGLLGGTESLVGSSTYFLGPWEAENLWKRLMHFFCNIYEA